MPFSLKDEKAKEYWFAVERLEKQKKCDPGDVLAYCDAIINLEPDFAPAYLKRSEYAFNACNFAGAINDINRAIELGLNEAEAYYRRSRCYDVIGHMEEERIKDIKTAAKLDPKHPQAAGELGHYYFEYPDRDYKKEAYMYYTVAIDNHSSDPLVFMRRGIINMDEGRYEYAIVDFLDSQKCNPKNKLVYYLRANCYYEIGALDRAIRDYKAASLIDQIAPDPFYKLGCVYYDKGDYENSIQSFNRLINLLPDSETGYFSRGVSYLALNDFENAAADFEKALSINPNDAPTHYLLSQAYLGAGEDDKALPHHEQAIALGYQPEEA